MRLKDRLRETLYSLLYALTGPGQGLRVILLYHSVGTAAPYGISPEVFEAQMRLLVERFKVVRISDLPLAVQDEPPGTNVAVVTFDDGCLDNYEVALPILDRLGIKATFFVVTGFLGKRIRTDAGERVFMQPSQVLDLFTLGHEVGSHTVHHAKLTQLSPAAARQEVEDSKKFLEDLLQAPIHSFAYPKGLYSPTIRRLVASVGYKVAVTTEPGLVSRRPDWLTLPRVWIQGSLSLSAFETRLSPATNVYRFWRQLSEKFVP